MYKAKQLNSFSLQVLYLCKRGELLMNQRKSLKELNLLDKFLFDEAMDDPENVKTMLDIILSQNTNLKHPPQREKEQRTSTDNRQIRLDVYAIYEDDVIYEVEAQKENTHNLPKRSRLYQGIIDSKLLPPGVVDFNLLNTRGKHPELLSAELIELLKYMERSTDEVSGECKSKRIQEMHRRVCQIKASEKTEVKYMQTWEERILIKQEGIAEGKQIGVEQINRLNQRLIEQGRFEDLTKAASDKVYQEKLLKEFEI